MKVLIRVGSAGVNPVDTYIRMGLFAQLPSLPYTPGRDGAGIVEKVGCKVDHLKVNLSYLMPKIIWSDWNESKQILQSIELIDWSINFDCYEDSSKSIPVWFHVLRLWTILYFDLFSGTAFITPLPNLLLGNDREFSLSVIHQLNRYIIQRIT